MGVGVGKYKVVLGCYVPVGAGLRYKYPGQVVLLSEDEAAKLADYLEPVEVAEDQGVAERNTPVVQELAEDQGVAERNTPVVQELAEDQGVAKRNTQDAAEEAPREVTSDVGDPETTNE